MKVRHDRYRTIRARQRNYFNSLLEALSFWRKGSGRSIVNTEESEFDYLNMAGTYNDTYPPENIQKDYSIMNSKHGQP
jgi:hypothetical protein